MPSAPYLAHVTSLGDRWDLLAWRYYGDVTLMGAIIQANPVLPIVGVFEAGVKIQIPILQKAPVATNDLPPWETL